MSKKILICEFHQESNTFNPVINPVERFNAGAPFEGEGAFQNLMAGSTAVHGAVDAITEMGGVVIPTIFMHSGSGGRVADEALEIMCQRFRHYAETAGDFDGVYCSLHGATCTVSEDDACGVFLQLVRELAGNKPIAASFDLHAKITKKILKNLDVICGYHTYPHVDFQQTGYRAGMQLMEILAGKQVYKAAVHLPVLLPPAGYTTKTGLFQQLMDSGLAMIESGKLVDFNLFPVQPWLDIPEIASCVTATAEDPETAKAAADQLAQGLAAMAGKVDPVLLPVEEIVEIAKKNTSGKPVILGDSADSPNGGAVGDSPVAAMAILGSDLRSVVCIRDPKAVEAAFALGVGASAEFSVGACLTPDMPGPMVANGTVKALFPKGGIHPELNGAAVVEFGKMQVVLCTNGTSSNAPTFYLDLGIDPAACDLVVVKANTSFRAHYAHISDLIYMADTPGAGAANLKLFTWKQLPAGMAPFADSFQYGKAELL